MLVSASKAREYDESDLLSRWIVTQSGQPLRDFTSIAAEVAQARNNPARLRTLGLPDEAIAALAGVKRYVRRTLWTIVPIVLILALFIGGSFFVSARLQDYQQGYFAGLVGKLHAETPLFSDPMSTDDGQWVVEKPSAADNQSSYAFVDGAYQMSGQSGQFVAAFAALVYGDAAVEVTARQVGAARDDTTQGVGLVLRSNGGTNMVVFYVSTVDGSWTLDHYLYNAQQPDTSLAYVDEGNSSAIQQGAGATNRLLVLARGQTYLLYINDRFITAYTDRYHDTHDLPVAGPAGVYVSDGAITGYFTDFAVYPVQAPPSLSYV
jgi:hypothetical protein